MTLTIRWLPPQTALTFRFAVPQPAARAPIAAVIGPPGPPGRRYVHHQTVASAEWIVNHDLGVEPGAVSVRSPGNAEVIAEVVHVSSNQLRVLFAAPAKGSVVIL